MSTLAVNTITNAAGGNTAQINGMTPTADSLQGFRNRILNGGMVIDQRNAGAATTPSASGPAYLVDRFAYYNSQVSRLTYQQNAAGVTPPTGFSNYLGITVASAATVGASDEFDVFQRIEGFNTADFGFGTASASAVTLSFWVRSSLTGTFGGSLSNSGNSRSYAFTYTINSANTWERKSVTVAGDTSGTWLTTNGIGLSVLFSMGAGSSLLGPAGSWASASYAGATGQVNLVATSGATFYITGVQLEAGSVATPFERRDYGRELIMCQRYFEKSYNTDVVPGTATTAGVQYGGGPQGTGTTGEVNAGTIRFKVTKRATPTMTAYDSVGNSGKCSRVLASVAGYNNQPVALVEISVGSVFVYSGGGDTATGMQLHYTASAEL